MILTPEEIRAMRATSLRSGARLFWELAEAIAVEFDVSVADLKAEGRGPLLVNEARQFLCLYAIRRGISSAQIGRFLGGRDHSTILHAAKKAEEKELASLE